MSDDVEKWVRDIDNRLHDAFWNMYCDPELNWKFAQLSSLMHKQFDPLFDGKREYIKGHEEELTKKLGHIYNGRNEP